MRAALGVGLVSFIAFVAAPQRVQSDSIYMVPLALELVQHGTLTLDRYAETCARLPHGCAELNGHLRSEFPVGPALVAAVPLGLFEALVHLTAPLSSRIPPLANQVQRWEAHAHARGDVDLSFFDVTENLLASLCCAAAAVFFVLAARQRLPVREAVVLALVFALGTAVFSTASRVLWQSGPALLFASLALWLLVSGRVGLLLGASLAAAWVCRPTMALFGVALLVVLLRAGHRPLLRVLAGGAVVAGAFLGANEFMLGAWLPPYFHASRLEGLGPTALEAAAGQLISPGRGLLVFTPVLVLVPWALVQRARAVKGAGGLELALGAWLVGHWVVISTFPHWWGGHSFGPRLWTEAMLGACWVLWPVLLAPRLRFAFAALALVGVLIHAKGASSGAAWRWNDTPVNVDEAPERLWDWGDLQFLR